MIKKHEQKQNFVDEVDCGNFFDNIDDLLDFPCDDITDSLPPPSALDDNGSNRNDSVFFENTSFPDITDSLLFPGDDFGGSGLSNGLSVPYEDIVQLEWLSSFVEDSLSGGSLTMKKEEEESFVNKDSSSPVNHFRTSSPVSVLDSNSSCSVDKTVPQSPEFIINSGRCGRARSKRPRPSTFTPRPPMQMQLIPSPESSVAETPQAVVSPKVNENFAESRLMIKMPKPVDSEFKKKKFKITIPKPPADDVDSKSAPIRKCMHCEVTKTPQWRAGPMGPKTLCNACGVRYKSGRLFPEYRPAASPTFVPSLHSNSHKKVLEMRNKGGEDYRINVMKTSQPELIPNNIAVEYM